MKKIGISLSLALVVLTFVTISAFASSNVKTSFETEKQNYILELETIKANNEKILNSRSSSYYKGTITLNNLYSLSEAKEFINKNNVNTHGVYMKFVEENGIIGTGYQIIKNDDIKESYIRNTEAHGATFKGITSIEAILTADEYKALSEDNDLFVIELADNGESDYPASHYWNAEKYGLLE